MWLASCRWVGSSAGLGHWGLLPKRWLRLGRARPRAPRARPIFGAAEVGYETVVDAPCRGFPRRAQPAEDHRGNPRAGAVSCTPPECPRNQPYRWRGHTAQNRNPGFDPSPPNNTKCTPANPNSNPTHGLPQPPPHPVARCPDLIVGVCGRAAPPPTTTQPTPPTVGHQPQPPTGVKAGIPRTHQNQQSDRPQPQARSVGPHTHQNQPPTARREADTPTPPAGAGVSTTHTPATNTGRPQPQHRAGRGHVPAPGAAPPKSCESIRNPHGVEGCLKTATTNPTMTLLGHRRFSAATRHHLLARADHAGAGVCGRAPLRGFPWGVPPDPLLLPVECAPLPHPMVVCARRAGSLPGGPGCLPRVVCPGGTTRCVQRCLVGCLGALPVGVAPSRWGVRSTGRAASPQAAVALAGGCVAARRCGVQAAPVMCGAGCGRGGGVVFRG